MTTQKVKIYSTLTDAEKVKIYRDNKIYCQMVDGEYSGVESIAAVDAIADAAARRAIEDLKVPPIEWFEKYLGTRREIEDARAVVQRYIDDVKAGKL